MPASVEEGSIMACAPGDSQADANDEVRRCGQQLPLASNEEMTL